MAGFSGSNCETSKLIPIIAFQGKLVLSQLFNKKPFQISMTARAILVKMAEHVQIKSTATLVRVWRDLVDHCVKLVS